MLLQPEHAVLQFQNEIQQICKPLFDKTPITYFEYSRYYQNGDFWSVNTNSHLTQQYLRHKCYPDVGEFTVNTARYALFSQEIPLPTAAKQAEEKYVNNIKIFESFDVKHRLYIDEFGDDFFMACGFGTDLDGSAAIEYFINNYDIFNKFINYFVIQGQAIIKQCEASKIKLFPELGSQPPQNTVKPVDSLSDEKPLFVYSINGIMLSKPEYDCLQHMAHGKRAKEIAKVLSISYKTVQTYIDRIKIRFACSHKSQLIEMYCASRGDRIII